MWWQFQKIFEDERFVRYAYSRENKDLDGIIEYDRQEETVTVLQPCKADEGSAFSERKAKEMFRYLVRENFPERRQAACG